MKNITTTLSKGLGFIGLFGLVLGAFLTPVSKVEAQAVSGWMIVTPSNICSGESTQLKWATSDATSITISPGIGSVAPSGERTISPTQTTTYTMTISNSAGGYNQGTATVTVTGSCTPPPPVTHLPTVSLSANPSSVAYNGSSTLTWNSTNATSCNATSGTNGWSGLKATSGTFNTGALTNTTSYGITCTNSAGNASDSTTVTVGGQPVNNPTVNLTANPSSISSGESSIVTWSSANATSCTGTFGTNGWTGLKATSGSFHTGSLYGSTTFGITCTNNSGSASDSATVFVGTVVNNPNVTTYAASNISTNSATLNGFVTGGNSSTNAWFQWGTSFSNLFNSTNQQYQGSGSSNFSAPIFGLSPNTTYYFRAAAQGNGGTVYGNTLSFTTTNNFVVPPQPSVNITADSTNLAYNGATFIRWNSSNATTCIASGGSLGWSGAKSTGPASFYTGAMTGSRTFVITCTGIYGSATDSVTVTVRPRVIVIGTTPAPIPTQSSLLIVTSSVDRNQPILPTIDNTMPRPGDEINYTISYRNVGNASLTNLNLQIVLPAEVDYMFSTPSNPSVFGQTLMFNLGTLRANTEGQVTVRVRVRENIAPGTVLNFPATLTYTDANGQPQSVSANVTAEVFRDGESKGVFLGANVFGAGFLPGNLFGWLLLIILILLLVLLAKYLFGRDNNRYVLAAAPSPHDHNNGYNTHSVNNGHGTTTERTTTTTHN